MYVRAGSRKQPRVTKVCEKWSFDQVELIHGCHRHDDCAMAIVEYIHTLSGVACAQDLLLHPDSFIVV